MENLLFPAPQNISWWRIITVFCHLKMSWFLKHISSRQSSCGGGAALSIQNLKIAVPPPSVPRGFWWEGHCFFFFSNCFHPTVKVLFLLRWSQYFFELQLSKLTMWDLSVCLPNFSLLKHTSASRISVFTAGERPGAFRHSFFKVARFILSSLQQLFQGNYKALTLVRQTSEVLLKGFESFGSIPESSSPPC